jgi:hypothetical protein
LAPGVTIFGDFTQFWEQKNAFFLKTHVMNQFFPQTSILYFEQKTPNVTGKDIFRMITIMALGVADAYFNFVRVVRSAKNI